MWNLSFHSYSFHYLRLSSVSHPWYRNTRVWLYYYSNIAKKPQIVVTVAYHWSYHPILSSSDVSEMTRAVKTHWTQSDSFSSEEQDEPDELQHRSKQQHSVFMWLQPVLKQPSTTLPQFVLQSKDHNKRSLGTRICGWCWTTVDRSSVFVLVGLFSVYFPALIIV